MFHEGGLFWGMHMFWWMFWVVLFVAFFSLAVILSAVAADLSGRCPSSHAARSL